MAASESVSCRIESVAFLHPGHWSRTIDRSDEGISVGLESTGASFAIVGVYPPAQEPRDVVEQVLDSLRDEFPQLEVEEIDDERVDAMTVEAVFFSLDVLSYCWMRCWRVGANTVLVFVQCVEPEADEAREAFATLIQTCKPVAHHTST